MFANLFFEVEPFAAILIAHGTQERRVYGLFVPKTFRSQYALDDSFPGRFVPWTFRSLASFYFTGPILIQTYHLYRIFKVNLC